MNKDLLNFLDSLTCNDSNIRWADSGPDYDYFNICADKLNNLKVKTILDICCGRGSFVDRCRKRHGMEAYGIDPSITTKDNLYKGTIESVLKNQNLLNDFKFDCISIHNTLHGRQWQNDELISILQFLKKFAKYIVISDPINNEDVKLTGLTNIHSFEGSHRGKSTNHRIYKVN